MFEITNLKKLLKEYKIRPNKKFGQNFLINNNIVDKTIRSLSNITKSNILEIGPGIGILSDALLKKNIKSLTVIEINKKFLPILKKIKYQTNKSFRIINADALKIIEEDIIVGNYKIVANLPYNIGTLLLIKWFKKILFIDEIIIMLQKEVANRIFADIATSAYGRITVLAQYVCHCEKLFDVGPENFFPAPRIYSSVIKLTPKFPKATLSDIENIEKISKVTFNFRRKKIKKSLKQFFTNPEFELKKIGIDFNKRPEELTSNEFYKISCILK